MNARFLTLAVAFFALLGIVQTLPAEARSRDGSLTSLHDVYVPADQVVDGDVNVVFGDAKIAGIVRGDCNAPFGHCTIVDNGQVNGHVYSGADEGTRAFLPWAFGSGVGALAEQDHRLLVKLAGSAVVVLMFLLFPLRMRVALDRVEKHPALSALTGTIAVVAVVPIAILLLISIIGIPLVFLEIAALFAGVWIGTGALALLVGRRLCELVLPASTPSPLLALVLGLVVVSAAEIVPVIGWAVSALVWLVGLGAAILSFIRSVQLDTAVQRAPVGGPPMRNLR
ncbi:MAG: polymer-forming cytoskeletal protein [Candidatus Eremiobacteraeota bacterium]|nr:polymer-forming cytoskeletal protein [Candidatus Eremiobacteraeota bacterium]